MSRRRTCSKFRAQQWQQQLCEHAKLLALARARGGSIVNGCRLRFLGKRPDERKLDRAFLEKEEG